MNYVVNYCGKIIDEKSKALIEKYHYSKSARSLKQIHVFQLISGVGLIGVAVFGQVNSKHNLGKKQIELRKLALIDRTQRNAESYFIGACLRWLRKNEKDNDSVITFADPNNNHYGTIYKATNFTFLGEESNHYPKLYQVKKTKETFLPREVYQKSITTKTYTKKAVALQQLLKQKKVKVIKLEKKLKFEYKLR